MTEVHNLQGLHLLEIELVIPGTLQEEQMLSSSDELESLSVFCYPLTFA